jgi:sRNA-binding protein
MVKLTIAATAEEQLAQLRMCYPKAFRTPPKPLALETQFDLLISMRPRVWDNNVVLPKTVRAALDMWTHSPAYLTACTVGAIRYNLKGRPAGVVTDREAGWAAEQLSRGPLSTVIDYA